MTTLGEHQGSGIRFDMHLSAPNGGVAQMLCRPEGHWVSWSEYQKVKAQNDSQQYAGNELARVMEDILGTGMITCQISRAVMTATIARWKGAKTGR